MLMCFLCGRRIKRAAASKTIHTTDPVETITGYAGRTCARRAGLIKPRSKTQRTADAAK